MAVAPKITARISILSVHVLSVSACHKTHDEPGADRTGHGAKELRVGPIATHYGVFAAITFCHFHVIKLRLAAHQSHIHLSLHGSSLLFDL